MAPVIENNNAGRGGGVVGGGGGGGGGGVVGGGGGGAELADDRKRKIKVILDESKAFKKLKADDAVKLQNLNMDEHESNKKKIKSMKEFLNSALETATSGLNSEEATEMCKNAKEIFDCGLVSYFKYPEKYSVYPDGTKALHAAGAIEES